ncbi:aroma-sacti cluster domain-containing protein [Edaphobacter bradus]|uniref:aroma-sacti cluster domain-containing protein n=1 Tax=Edaphobacter bradus TaxID=2259016 RepID=UPI0021E0E4E1|nr:aroma-sacti cluster domain-containing protein [Edaphobacter bradus]
MSAAKSNFERLNEAGALDPKHFTEDDKKVIESLTTDETEALIKLRKKMGQVATGKDHMRPNFPV